MLLEYYCVEFKVYEFTMSQIKTSGDDIQLYHCHLIAESDMHVGHVQLIIGMTHFDLERSLLNLTRDVVQFPNNS